MVRRSVPASSRWTAKAWRNACGVTGLARSGLVPHGPAGVLHGGGRDRLTRQIAGEQPLLRPNAAVVVSEDVQQLGREHDVSVLPPFALLHANGHASAIDRCRRQVDRLRNPQTCRVADGQDHAVLEALDSVGSRRTATHIEDMPVACAARDCEPACPRSCVGEVASLAAPSQDEARNSAQRHGPAIEAV